MTRQLTSLIFVLLTLLSAGCLKIHDTAKILSSVAQAPTIPGNLPTQYVEILGSAAQFALLGGSTTTGAGGATTVVGSVGASPGTSITGLINITDGSVHAGDPISLQAQVDARYAYETIKAKCGAEDISGQDLGGKTLGPGTYKFMSSCALTSGTLVLDGKGDPNALWFFQIGSTLITGPYSNVVMINSGSPLNVYWQVGSSSTISGISMCGNIIAQFSITLGPYLDLKGRAIARGAALTFTAGKISIK